MEDSRTVNVVIGGEAGQGLATLGQLLAKSLVRAGYEIVVTQSYESRIRGGSNTFAIRVGAGPARGPAETIDVLVAMNQETVTQHGPELGPGGVVLLDEKLDPGDVRAVRVPFKTLAPKPIFQNVAALGVAGSLMGLDMETPAKLLADSFHKKGDAVVEQNRDVLAQAYAWAGSHDVPVAKLPPVKADGVRLMMNGNTAIALGALAAGAKFCSFYPMTPGTSVAQALINHSREMGVVVEQAEDEIAALNMALGASYAGARSIVPTSGGGFALMVEAVSLAGVMETPVVVVLAQRPGPATGLPTRTEQGDLNLVLYAGHGEFPRAIFAPGNIDQCFHLAHRAFDQAELHQSPVFILTEQYLADSYRAVEPFDLDSLPEPVLPDFETADPDGYERYAFTESGVSPRLAPGFSKALVVADSHEHTPQGHITEDQEIRTRMVDKRLRKGRGLVEDAIPPDLYGDESPDTLLVCWGGALGPAVEAGELLRHQGDNVSVLHFSQVWPLNPDHFLPILRRAGRTVCVEGNATGQFAGLLRQETGFKVDALVLRYDGRPFTARYIMDRLPQAK